VYLPVIDITKHLVWPQFKSFCAVKIATETDFVVPKLLWTNCKTFWQI